MTVTVKDTTNATGTASFTWTINPVGGGCSSPGQKLGNPGFETGTRGALDGQHRRDRQLHRRGRALR